MLSQGFAEPTPVQAACWPPACAGQDVQGVAQPGSGKTLAYLLSAAVRLQVLGHTAKSQPRGPALLVITPTRELAQQVAQVWRGGLRAATGLRCACVYGGVPREQQVASLAKLPHVLVATPGRLLDLVDHGLLHITPPSPGSATTPRPAAEAAAAAAGGAQGVEAVPAASCPEGVAVVVLDEADKMLSLGFEPQLARLHQLLLPATPAVGSRDPATKSASKAGSAASKRHRSSAGGLEAREALPAPCRPQVLLFTATMPAAVAEAAARWLHPDAVKVAVNSASAEAISKTITQVVQVCAEHKKPAKLLRHLVQVQARAGAVRNPPRILVFANRVKTVRYLHELLAKEGYRVVQLHGARSQLEREEAMRLFKAGKAQVMVATDVAARGLDIRLLPYVVNYDFPSSLDTYIHRVGRTGRLAAYGHSYSFFTRNLARIAGPLIQLLQQHEQAIDPNLAQLADAWQQAEERVGAAALATAAALAAREGRGEVRPEGEVSESEDEEVGGEGAVPDDPWDARMEVEDLMEGLGTSKASNDNGVKANPGKKRGREKVGSGPQPGQVGEEEQVPAATAHRVSASTGNGSAHNSEVQAAMMQALALANGTKAKKQRRKAEAGEEAGDGPKQNLSGPSSMAQRLAVAVARGTATAQSQASASREAVGQPPFIPSQRFAGARAGYAFKKGPDGMGYYRDHPPAKLNNPVMQLRGKGPIIPIGPQSRKGKQSWDDSSDEGDPPPSFDQAAAALPNAQADASASRAIISNGNGVHKRKALPGRLRKKLAKERAGKA
ncbi:P-loop containing nucleoside triphosphate hydrolase protein [Haematococcus lacustris]